MPYRRTPVVQPVIKPQMRNYQKGVEYYYSNYMYSSTNYQILLLNSIYLIHYNNNNNNILITLNFVSHFQYCRFTECSLVNNSFVKTPKDGIIKITDFQNTTNNIQNATLLRSIVKNNYGCSIHFDGCLETNGSHILTPNYALLIIMILLI